MILGLSSYTYGWSIGVPGFPPPVPMDATALLERAAGHGIRAVQLCENLRLPLQSEVEAHRLREQARRHGIRLEVGSRNLTAAHGREMIEFARRVGARLIRFVVDGPGYRPAPGEIISCVRELLPDLDGFVLGLENHDRLPARLLRGVVEEVASDRVGICLDTANSLGAGEGLGTVVAELAPLAVNLHLKDFHIARVPHQMGFTVEGRPAGSGMLDLPWLLEEVARSGRCETAILELWTPPESSIEATVAKEEAWARQSLEVLQPLLNGR
ncbi:MAG: sugar phosphate isomerase/epimerase [Verrucomicrobiales bacterium]|nr:sugar phosphate isomerase/epimerase [Verrucomicrobiales bacterium]